MVTPEILVEWRCGIGKVTFSVQKLSKISETGQDRTKVAIEDQKEFSCALSIDA